jgi:D-3-phosphoglycerate dehydrogenase
MKSKVLIPQPIAKAGIDYLSDRGYELLCPGASGHDDMVRNIADCEALLLRTAPVDKEILEAGKKLRLVARHGAGFDHVDIQAAAELGIWVTNAPLSTSCSVAEYTMGMILMLAKRIPFFINELKKGNFTARMQYTGMEIANKTLGIIGLGRIGIEIAKKAINGFAMKVTAYDPFCPSDRVPPGVRMGQTLEAVVKEADFISLHVPNTPETKKFFGAALFDLMKPGAYFINAARGELFDEAALRKALESEKIAGAVIDVYDPEPPSPDNPLFKAPNLIATPHIASNTAEATAKMALHAAQEIHRVLSGEKPLWPVNKPVFRTSKTNQKSGMEK